MKPTNKRMYSAALMGFAILLVMIAGPASGMYLNDGSKETAPGVYENPNDGVCVIGVAADGTMLIDTAITNARDCAAYTRSAEGTANLRGMTTEAACTQTGNAGNTAIGGKNYKYRWATSNTCVNAADPTVAISLVDLDRTAAMCTSKGGTTLTSTMCVANGWVYMNRDADNNLPFSGTAIPDTTLVTTTGTPVADDLGFCYATMRMTSATYTSSATCPSYHNSPTLAPAEWPACQSSTTGCQTQASFDAGLGWSWDATNSRCTYDYAVKGILNANLTNTNNTRPTLPDCAGGSTTGTAGNCVDLTGITTQGACLAAGGTWDNWLIKDEGRTTKTNADAGYAGLPADAVIVKLDAITPIADGGGNFRTGTGAVCLKCHSDQSRTYMERDKPGFVETPHQKAGDTAGPWQEHFTAENSDWGLKGVQCTMCHSTARPAQDDLIQVVPAGTVGPPAAGAPVSATGHNKTEYGSAVTDVCFHCHGNFPSGNAANVVPVSSGDFALTPKGLPPIGNQFLNSPHAKFTGSTSAKVDISNKSNYLSTFAGYICRSSNSVGGGSILTTAYQSGEAIKIPFVDALINTVCSNAGNGTASSGAAGFWVRDGESNTGATPLTTDQGSCMTCHDVHWAFDSEIPGAEPIRRECTTCHVDPGTQAASASAAPQVTTVNFRHPAGEGTPLEEINTDPVESCEICHMPKSSETGARTHLWRISTNSEYSTMGTTSANTAADGDYEPAAWVDLDHSCGQCHNSSGSAHLFDNEALSSLAEDMHTGPTPTTDCATCHATAQGDAYAIQPNMGPTDNHHGQFSYTCADCHPRGGVSPEPTNEFCAGCHPPEPGLHQIAPGVTHHNGTCVDCHVPGDNVGAGGVTGPGILPVRFDCNICHPNRPQAKINHPDKPSLGTPDCSGCHGQGGFTPSITVCNGCHGGSNGPGGASPFLSAAKLQRVFDKGLHKNVAPTAAMMVGAFGLTVSVTDTSTDADYDLESVVIEWGDKTKTSAGPGQTRSHTYSTPGKKKITLTATDSRGVKAKAKSTITISDED